MGSPRDNNYDRRTCHAPVMPQAPPPLILIFFRDKNFLREGLSSYIYSSSRDGGKGGPPAAPSAAVYVMIMLSLLYAPRGGSNHATQ